MPKSARQEPSGAVADLVGRLVTWWRQTHELREMPSGEMDRVAAELGVTRQDLADLAARGTHASDLLYERMAVLGLTRADVDRVAFGIIRDLEKSCSCCGDKARCEKDLADRPRDRVWTDYCPNAVTLDALSKTKGRFPV